MDEHEYLAFDGLGLAELVANKETPQPNSSRSPRAVPTGSIRASMRSSTGSMIGPPID